MKTFLSSILLSSNPPIQHLPILLSSNLSILLSFYPLIFQSSYLPILLSSNPPIFQSSYPPSSYLPILLSSNPPIFLSSYLPIFKSSYLPIQTLPIQSKATHSALHKASSQRHFSHWL